MISIFFKPLCLFSDLLRSLKDYFEGLNYDAEGEVGKIQNMHEDYEFDSRLYATKVPPMK